MPSPRVFSLPSVLASRGAQITSRPDPVNRKSDIDDKPSYKKQGVDTLLGMWKAYQAHRAEAHSLAAKTRTPRKDGPPEGGAALRLATPASPFSFEPTFAVVECGLPTGSGSTKAWVLAEIVEGSRPRTGSIRVEYYSTEAEDFEGRRVFSRNGLSDSAIPACRFRVLEPGAVKHLDVHGQRVSMNKGASLRDVFVGATMPRTRTDSLILSPSTWRRRTAHSPQDGGTAKRTGTATPPSAKRKGKGGRRTVHSPQEGGTAKRTRTATPPSATEKGKGRRRTVHSPQEGGTAKRTRTATPPPQGKGKGRRR